MRATGISRLASSDRICSRRVYPAAFPSRLLDHDEPRFLLYDRDTIFAHGVTRHIKDCGIRPLRIAPQTPRMNAFAERWIRTVREQLLDHVLPRGTMHLIGLLRQYIAYYNRYRCHQGIGRDAPDGRAIEQRAGPEDRIVSVPVLNGLVHHYHWKSAA